MELESIRVTDVLPVAPARLYEAWMDEATHSALTGGAATIEPVVGGKFTAWDGYISGTHVALVPGEKIVQRWRSTDFPPGAEDSLLVVTFAPDPGGTLVTIEHTEIPVGQGESYEQGWVDYYFAPMKVYFTRADVKPAKKAAPAKKKAAAKKAASAKKKAAPAKKKAAAKKAAPAKKRAAAKKAAPAKKKAAAKKAAPAKKRAAAKKAAPAKKKAAAKKAAPARKKAAAKKPVPSKRVAKKSTSAKTARRTASSTGRSPSEKPPKR